MTSQHVSLQATARFPFNESSSSYCFPSLRCLNHLYTVAWPCPCPFRLLWSCHNLWRMFAWSSTKLNVYSLFKVMHQVLKITKFTEQNRLWRPSHPLYTDWTRLSESQSTSSLHIGACARTWRHRHKYCVIQWLSKTLTNYNLYSCLS